MIVLTRKGFSDIHRGENHKYISLDKSHQKLKKPKWKREKFPKSSMKRRNKRSYIDSYRDEDRSNKNIQKEANRE